MANAILNVGQTGGQVNISTAAAPATPAAGIVTLYAGTDKALHVKNSDGTDITIAAGMTGPTGPQGQTGATGPAGSNATSPITLEQTNSLVSTGIGATATSNNAVVIGATACAVGVNSVVIGLNATNVGVAGNAVVIGNCACTNTGLDYGGHVVIGYNARGGYAGAGVVIGQDAIGDSDAVAILNTTVGTASVSIGKLTRSAGLGGVSIGYNTNAGGNFSLSNVSIGKSSNNSSALGSINIGDVSVSQSDCTIGIGVSSTIFTGATGTIVLGAFSVGGTGACNSVVIGNSSQVNVANSIFIGPGTINKSSGALNGAIVIGQNACIYGSAYNGHIVIGRCACAQEQNSTVVIGDGAIGENIGVAIGCSAQAGTASVSIGGQSFATGLFAVATGRFSRAVSQESVALGYNSCGNATYATALGANSCAAHTCSVALGPGITTERVNTVHLNSLIAYGQAASKTNAIGSTGGSVTLNWDNSNIQTLTLTDSITTLTKSNPIDGAVYTLFLTQGGTGGKTVSWGADVEWPGGTPPTLSTAAGATDAVSLVYIAGVTGYYGNANLNFS
jgi:hypothetical protein